MASQAPLGTKALWNTPGVSLPGPFRSLVRELRKNGVEGSRAFAVAWSQARKWATLSKNAETRARWGKVVAQLEAARAKAKATPNKTAHELAGDALALATVELDNSGSGPTTTQLDAGSRRTHARRGISRPDGSYPIRNATDLANAIAAYGRSKPADRAKVRAHIVKRAKALGIEGKLPESWRQVAASHGLFDALALAGRGTGPQRYRHGWIPVSGASDKPRFADGASGAKRLKLDAAQVQDVRDRLAVLEQYQPEIARRQRALLNGLHADGKLTSDRLRIAKGGIDRLISNHRPRQMSSDPDLVAFSHGPAEALALATKTYSHPKSGSTTVSKADADDPRVKAMAAKLMAKGYGNLERCTKVATAIIRRGKGAKGGNAAKVAASHPLALAANSATHTPPDSVQSNAKRALELIRDGKAGAGFTAVGRARARQLASGTAVSTSTVRQMRAYFARHAKGDQGQQNQAGTPANVAWLAWGGDAGKRWAESVLRDEDSSVKTAHCCADVGSLPIEQVAAYLALAKHRAAQRFRHGWIPIVPEAKRGGPGRHAKKDDAPEPAAPKRAKATSGKAASGTADKVSTGEKAGSAKDHATRVSAADGLRNARAYIAKLSTPDLKAVDAEMERRKTLLGSKAKNPRHQAVKDEIAKRLKRKTTIKPSVKAAHGRDTIVTDFDIDAARLALSNLQTQLDELALAMPPQLAKAQRAGKTGAKKTPKPAPKSATGSPSSSSASSKSSASGMTNPDSAETDVQIPAGQEDAFKKLVAQIMKRPGMDVEKAEKVAAALLRNRKPAKNNA